MIVFPVIITWRKTQLRIITEVTCQFKGEWFWSNKAVTLLPVIAEVLNFLFESSTLKFDQDMLRLELDWHLTIELELHGNWQLLHAFSCS